MEDAGRIYFFHHSVLKTSLRRNDFLFLGMDRLLSIDNPDDIFLNGQICEIREPLKQYFIFGQIMNKFNNFAMASPGIDKNEIFFMKLIKGDDDKGSM